MWRIECVLCEGDAWLIPRKLLQKTLLEISNGVKTCTKCKKVLSLDNFLPKRGEIPFLAQCKNCQSEASKRAENNPFYKFRRWALNTIKTHKVREGHSINITVEYLESLAERTTHCEYCGRLLNWERGTKGKSPRSDNPTLDRIKNESEINKDNIAIVCMRCNTTKGYHTMEEFIEYCKSVVRHIGGK